MSTTGASSRRRLAGVLAIAAVILVCAIVALTRGMTQGAAYVPVHLDELPRGCTSPPGATAFMCIEKEYP